MPLTKASDFLKKYEQQRREREGAAEDKEDKEDHSLEGHARARAANPTHLNAGTPHDWEDLERYRRELERLEREGPGSGD